jgi:hypothetical protein
VVLRSLERRPRIDAGAPSRQPIRVNFGEIVAMKRAERVAAHRFAPSPE